MQPNRKWKYGVSRLNELAIHDFLFDFNTIYGPNCHRLAARNYFWSRRHRKWRHHTSFNVQEDSNSLQWAGQGYFRSPKITSGQEITISGLTSARPLTSVALCGGLLATTQRIRTLLAADGHFRSNRKWKYGGNRVNELAIHDFLFDFHTIYGPNCHRLAARHYFRSGRHRKWQHQTSFNVQEHRNIRQWARGS